MWSINVKRAPQDEDLIRQVMALNTVDRVLIRAGFTIENGRLPALAEDQG
jgi:hypothetical protein